MSSIFKLIDMCGNFLSFSELSVKTHGSNDYVFASHCRSYYLRASNLLFLCLIIMRLVNKLVIKHVLKHMLIFLSLNLSRKLTLKFVIFVCLPNEFFDKHPGSMPFYSDLYLLNAESKLICRYFFFGIFIPFTVSFLLHLQITSLELIKK